MTTSVLTSSKTPAIIITEILMMNSIFKGTHFLVEGDDDSKFWKTRVAKGLTAIVNCEGRPNLLGASQIIVRRSISPVAGVYDADFEHLFGVVHSPNVLTPTDENDLEVTILATEALDVLLNEYADEKLIYAFEEGHGISVRQHLEGMSREFGMLRLINRQLSHMVDFDRLSPYRFISPETWVLDVLELRREYASLANITFEQLTIELGRLVPNTRAWGLCQGHDSVRVLAIGLRRKIGKKQISEQDLAKILRIAYSLEMLQQSKMYKAIKEIEERLAQPILSN